MNNINKKNAINNLNKKTTLPIENEYNVDLKANQIAHIALNYALQKLLDNDMYIERKFLLESNYTIGPKNKSSKYVQDANDYIKYYDGIDGVDNNLSIVQKIPKDVASTITLNISNTTVNFILENCLYFAGTNNGLYQSENLESWKKVEFDAIKDKTITSYYSNYDKILFAVKDDNDEGIYMLSGFEAILKKDYAHAICQKIYNGDSTATYLDNRDLYIGHSNGIKKAKFDGQNVTDVQTLMSIHNKVNTINKTNGKILVGATNGLYESTLKYALSKFEQISNKTTFTCFYNDGDALYVGATDGLYMYKNNVLSPILTESGQTLSKINKIAKENEKMYFCSEFGLYSFVNLNTNFSERRLTPVLEHKAYDVCSNGSIIAVGSDDGIYWKNVKNNATEWQYLNLGNDIKTVSVANDGSFICTSTNSIYHIVLETTEKPYVIRVLVPSTTQSECSTVTSIYTDTDMTILIGAVEGLFDKNYNKVSILNDSTGIFISDRVNSIKYGAFNGTDMYLVNTVAGTYVMTKNASGQFLLKAHFLTTKNTIDSVISIDNLIIVCNDGFHLFKLKMNGSTIEISSEDNFSELPNNSIEKMAQANSLYCLDRKNIYKYQTYINMKNQYEDYAPLNCELDYFGELTSFRVQNLKVARKVEDSNRKFVVYDGTIAGVDQYVDLTAEYDDAPYTSFACISAMQYFDEKCKNTKCSIVNVMPPNMLSSCVLFADQNSKNLSVLETSRYIFNSSQKNKGIKASKVSFGSNIVQVQSFYSDTFDKNDYILRSKNIRSIVQTKDKLLAASTKIGPTDDYVFLTYNNTNKSTIVDDYIAIPYIYNNKRHNFYISTIERTTSTTTTKKISLYSSENNGIDGSPEKPVDFIDANGRPNIDNINAVKIIGNDPYDVEMAKRFCNNDIVYMLVGTIQQMYVYRIMLSDSTKEIKTNTDNALKRIDFTTVVEYLSGKNVQYITQHNGYVYALVVDSAGKSSVWKKESSKIFDASSQFSLVVNLPNVAQSSKNKIELIEKVNDDGTSETRLVVFCLDSSNQMKFIVYSMNGTIACQVNNITNMEKVTYRQKLKSSAQSINGIDEKYYYYESILISQSCPSEITENTPSMLSTFDGTMINEIQYEGCVHDDPELPRIFPISLVKSYDQSLNTEVVFVQTRQHVLRYTEELEFIDYLSSYPYKELYRTINTKKVYQPLGGFFVEDTDGNTKCSYTLSEDGRPQNLSYGKDEHQLIICNNSGLTARTIINCGYYIDYKSASYVEIKDNGSSIVANDIKTYEFDNIDDCNELAEPKHFVNNILYLACNNGLYYTTDLEYFGKITCNADSRVSTNKIWKIAADNDEIVILISNSNNQKELVKCEINTDDIFNLDTATSASIGSFQDANIAYMDIQADDDEKTENKVYLYSNASGSRTKVYNNRTCVQKAIQQPIATNVNSIYGTDTQVLYCSDLGLNSIDSTGKIKKILNGKILNICDETTDSNVYVAGNVGLSTCNITKQKTLESVDDILSSTTVVNAYHINNAWNYLKTDNTLYHVENRNAVHYDYNIKSNSDIYIRSYGTIQNVTKYTNQNLMVNTTKALYELDTITDKFDEYKISSIDFPVSKFWIDKSQRKYILKDGTLYVADIGKDIYNKIEVGENHEQHEDVREIDDNFIIDENGLYSHEIPANVIYFNKLIVDREIYKIFNVGNSTALIGTSDGLYQYDAGVVSRNGVIKTGKVKEIAKAAKNKSMEKIQKYDQYLVCVGPDMYVSTAKSDKLNEFEFVTSLTKYDSRIQYVNSIKIKNTKEYAIGVDIGLLKTHNQYILSNNFVVNTLNGVKDKIDQVYASQVNAHIAQYHKSTDPITIANNTIIDTEFSNINDNWQTITVANNSMSSTVIKNDYVDTVEFNGSIARIRAEYQNYNTSYDYTTSSYSWSTLDEMSYIVKNWKSKTKEIYVYLPTTNTYYINHVDGLNDCSNCKGAIYRKNITTQLNGNIDETCTNIRLYLDNEYFDFDEIYDVQINGNSLPLGIYVDDKNIDNENGSKYYHSYILPSISKYAPLMNYITDSSLPLQGNEVVLEFSCFGSDAQAIQITARSKTYFYIHFNGNGADEGAMAKQKFQIGKRSSLSKNKFVKNGWIFKGWSLNKTTIVYVDQQEVYNLSLIDGTTIELYAMYEEYVMNAAIDTHIQLNSNKNEFSIANGKASNGNANVVIELDYKG